MSASAKTDRTDIQHRISSCETHLIDIEVVLDGLRLIDHETGSLGDPELSIRAHQIAVYLHEKLIDDAAALRLALWPDENIGKGSAS